MDSQITLKLAEIRVDGSLQPRTDGLLADHVRELETVGPNWPPIAVVHQGSGYLLVDGFHRFAAAQNLGLEAVPVKVLPIPGDGDLHALAFALNAVHGRPLTLSDRRAFALRVLRANPGLSDREIGRRSGLTQPPIAKLREDLESRQEIAPTENRVGSDGQLYRVNAGVQKRPAGALPAVGLESPLQMLMTPGDRRAQRRLAQYFERLAVALEDQYDLEGWDTHDDAAEACRSVLGTETVSELAQLLGETASNVLDVAVLLGYEPEAEEA